MMFGVCRLRVWSVVACLLAAWAVKAQSPPDFRADTTRGCAPLFVKFTNLTSGNPTSYFWDLGNGITSTQKNPTTFYFDAGSYTVKLMAITGADTQTVVKTAYIVVYDVPSVAFTVSDTLGCFPLRVQFESQATAGSGTIRELQWDFGDGTFSDNPSASHAYNVAGDFTISLRVTNSFGCTQLLSRPSYIKVGDGIKAGFGLLAGATCNPPVTVRFFDSSRGGSISSHWWSFGDGATSTQKNPMHTYTAPGVYNVKLAVANAAGCRDTVTLSNAVSVGSVKADFTAPAQACAGTSVSFTNTSSPAPTSVTWNFGDGQSANDMQPRHVFTTPGRYAVTLRANFGGCVATTSYPIDILPAPSAAFDITGDKNSCKLPVQLDFAAADRSGVSYQWRFGDGTTGTGPSATHTYDTAGRFTVALTVSGANGCTAENQQINALFFGPPIINGFENTPFKGCAPRHVTFRPNFATPDPVVQYQWTLGDNTTSTRSAPEHTYTQPGSYQVGLTITTQNGCTASFTQPAAVIVSERPKAAFSAAPPEACAFKKIDFTDASTGNISSWIWSFGDGGTSTEQNPSYSYTDTGYFNVRLIASNNDCVDTIELRRYIYIRPPVARFVQRFSCADPAVRQFVDTSIGAASWAWDFGDGNVSNLQSPVHTYAQSGTYSVKLVVTNGQCSHSVTDVVTVVNEQPELQVADNPVCVNTALRLYTTNIDTSLYARFDWDFNDGTYNSTAQSFTDHFYRQRGSYQPVAVLHDKSGCRRTITTAVQVSIKGPKAAFTADAGSCVQQVVQFTDQSQAQPQVPIRQWLWRFGDGSIHTGDNNTTQHSYSNAGLYSTSLRVTDADGCSDSIARPASVLITNPRAAFSVSDTLRCTAGPVLFASQSQGVALQHSWNFGDGLTSVLPVVTHVYTKEAVYPVRLVITDTFGCRDTATRQQAVRVANVKAAMQVSDSSSFCPPFIMNLFNRSQNFTSVLWDFNDGSFSDLNNPSHYFNTAGTYRVKLVATGYGNCKDSTVTTVKVNGPSGQFKYTGGTICAPGVTSFSAVTRNRASFIWDFGDGTTMVTGDSVVSHTYVNPGRYRPKMVLVDNAGCQVPITGRDTVTVARVDAGIRSVAPAYCDSASIRFTDSSIARLDAITSYAWRLGDGTTSTQPNPVHVYRQPGVYPVSLTVTTRNGCVSSAALQPGVKVVASPRVAISAQPAVCQQLPITFSAASTQPDTSAIGWRWTFGNGQSATGSQPAAVQFGTPGTYQVLLTATNSSGCATTATHALQVHATPAVHAGADTFVCRGKAITLQARGAATYAWQPAQSLSCLGCAAPVASPVSSTAYVVQGTSAQGCVHSDTVRVEVVQPFTISVSPADTLCRGESVRLLATGADEYRWTPAAGLSSAVVAQPVARPDTTTHYRVVVADAHRCFAETGYVKITVYPIPVFNIKEDNIILPAGSSVTLNTTSSADITRWRWLPGTGLSCNNCPQPVASPMSTTTYTAQATNNGGCKTEDRVTVTVVCSNANIYIPNTFSPNGDGMNDVFYVRGKGLVSVKSMTIYNRWGAVVFQSSGSGVNDPLGGWNGTHNGTPLSPDVYVYKVEVVCNNSTVIPLQGNITLVK